MMKRLALLSPTPRHVFLVVVCMWLCAVSCSSTDSDEHQSPFPTLGQLRSRLPQEAGSTDRQGSTDDGQPAAVLHVAQLDVPLNVPTEPAWALTSEQGLDPAMTAAWQANGIRLGLLKADDYEAFVQALPQDYPPRYKRTTLTEQPTACTTTPKHKDGSVIRLIQPPAQRMSNVQVGPGRFQFLAQLQQTPNGVARLRLTPHHHQPRVTVRPRLPQEKIQDGLVFDRLALSVPVDQQVWLVIGIHTPEDPQTTPSPDDKSDADTPSDPATTDEPATTQPATQPNTPKPANFSLPNHLGRAVLTASRFNKPIQMVLVVAVTSADEKP